MKTRIEIDGVWYVREDLTHNTIPQKTLSTFDETDVTHYDACIYEDDQYCWEAHRLRRLDGTLYDDISIEFTDKLKRENGVWLNEYWDSKPWLEGVYENNPESLKDAKEIMNPRGLATFQSFLGYLVNRGWLK